MNRGGRFDAIHEDALTVAMVALSLVAITLFDAFVFPHQNVTLLYTIPILIGALRTSTRIVIAIGASSIVVDTLNSFLVRHEPFESWLLRTIVLIAVTAFAALLAWQRGELAARTRELEYTNSHLREVEQQREEWIAVIAHDLRQPTTIVLGYAQRLDRLLRGQSYPKEFIDSIEHIQVAASNLNRMISDLLDVSRIEARRLILVKQPVDLPELTRAIVERMAGLTATHPVRLDINGSIPTIEADPARVEQMLGNLLSNAAKYASPNSPIIVQIERQGNAVGVAVTNYGEGITAEEIPRLFTRFYRTRAARQRNIGGIGLGLYLTRGLVEAHGGRISAASIPGQTTTFSFTLPIPEQSRPQAA